MKAELEALVASAAGWDGVADEVSSAQMMLWRCNGGGSQFGWFAARAGIDGEHDQFATAMIDAMASGTATLRDMARALRQTAKDFGVTDTDVADEFHDLDGTPR